MYLDITAIMLIMGLAAFIQSSIGFGFGLVVLALLSPVLGLREASITSVLAVLPLTVFLAYRHRVHVKWKASWLLCLMIVVGAPFGVKFLKDADLRILRTVMGAILVVSAVQRLLPKTADRPWPRILEVPCGLLSGALNGAFGTGGPPLLAYLSTKGYNRFSYVATLQILFAIGAIIRVEELVRQELFTGAILFGGMFGVVATLCGAIVGTKLLNRINEKLMGRLVTGGLLLLGLYYVGEVLVGFL